MLPRVICDSQSKQKNAMQQSHVSGLIQCVGMCAANPAGL